MRILLVEDDKLLGDGVQAGLAQSGFTVDWVKDGIAAELALKTGEYAGVVLDLGLPRLSGLDLLARLRRGGDKVPVLILTARDRVEDCVKGLDSGADDYLVKRFDLHELAAKLRPSCAWAKSSSTLRRAACASTASRSSFPCASWHCCRS